MELGAYSFFSIVHFKHQERCRIKWRDSVGQRFDVGTHRETPILRGEYENQNKIINSNYK